MSQSRGYEFPYEQQVFIEISRNNALLRAEINKTLETAKAHENINFLEAALPLLDPLNDMSKQKIVEYLNKLGEVLNNETMGINLEDWEKAALKEYIAKGSDIKEDELKKFQEILHSGLRRPLNGIIYMLMGVMRDYQTTTNVVLNKAVALHDIPENKDKSLSQIVNEAILAVPEKIASLENEVKNNQEAGKKSVEQNNNIKNNPTHSKQDIKKPDKTEAQNQRKIEAKNQRTKMINTAKKYAANSWRVTFPGLAVSMVQYAHRRNNKEHEKPEEKEAQNEQRRPGKR